MPFRTIRLLLFAVIHTLILAACGSTETPTAPPPADTATVATLTDSTPTNVSEPTLPATVAVPTETPIATPLPAPSATEVVIDTPVAQPEVEPVTESNRRTFQIVPGQSQASYAVEEEFFNRSVDFFTAIGTTSVFEGQFALNITDGQVELGENAFVVDLSTLTSNDSQRDRRIRNSWLESSRYPLAEFTATGLQAFPADAAEGQDIPFKVIGNMTIREVTQPLTFDTVARLEDGILTGSATTFLYMRDFGFEPPSMLGILEVTDGVTVTVNFVAQEVSP